MTSPTKNETSERTWNARARPERPMRSEVRTKTVTARS